MGRLQLALNVDDIDEAVDFYRRLFGTEPAKRRPGYANFAIWDPPLKLVLIENKGRGGTLNHLGVEVKSKEEVDAAEKRLVAEGLVSARDDGACCYAEQAKIWVHDPDDAPWEVYTVLADAPVGPHAIPSPGDAHPAVCCAPTPTGRSAAETPGARTETLLPVLESGGCCASTPDDAPSTGGDGACCAPR
jgi:catechol 2,3-dioxygenase-like lactoylglutathione lyase family enzyme